MLSDVVKFIPQNFKAIGGLQTELCLVKVEKLDACIRPLFANPVTYSASPKLSGYIYYSRFSIIQTVLAKIY